MTTLAEELFDNQIHTFNLEERLEDALDEILGDNEWSDYTYDYYDSSLEVYGCSISLNEEQRQEFSKLGFHQMWVHENTLKDSEIGGRSKETYYSLNSKE